VGTINGKIAGITPKIPPRVGAMLAAREETGCKTGCWTQQARVPWLWAQEAPPLLRFVTSTVGAARPVAARERMARTLVSCMLGV
jgi:hypothetical protein